MQQCDIVQCAVPYHVDWCTESGHADFKTGNIASNLVSLLSMPPFRSFDCLVYLSVSRFTNSNSLESKLRRITGFGRRWRNNYSDPKACY